MSRSKCQIQPRSVAAGRILSAALIALLLAAVLLPLAPTVVATDDDDPVIRIPGGIPIEPVLVDREDDIADDGPVIDGPILIQPSPTPAITIEDPILVEPAGDDPIIDGPILIPDSMPEISIDEDTQVQVGRITINKLACPDGIDAYDLSVYDLSLTCQTPLDGVEFVVTDGGVNHSIALTGLHGPGLIKFTNQPAAAPLSIVEAVPAGYGEPIVFCQNAADPAGASVQMPVTDGNQIFYQLQAGEYLSCLWYNVPAPADEPIYVTINKYLCPQDADADADDHDALGAACDKPLMDVEFTHDAAGDSQTATTDVDGQVFFTQQAAGETTLTESMPVNFGEPIVYCTIVGPIVQTYDRYETVAGSFTTTLGAGDQLVCDGYNVPLHPIGDAQVTIVKHECQPGYPDVYTYDPDGLISVCGAYLDGVNFTVSDGGPVNLSRTTGADGVGTAVFSYLDSGEYTITETVPDGYGEPIVWCAMGVVGGEEPEEYARYDLDAAGPAVFSVLVNDDALSCHWFNVPGEFEGDDDATGDTGSIHVRKFACPDGYDAYNANYFDLALTCQTPLDGVEFVVTDGGLNQSNAFTGLHGPGEIEFDNQPAATPLSIIEDVPAGYGEPVAFCTDPNDPNGDWIKATVTDGNQFVETLDAGQVLMCDWFNVPTAYAGDGQVTIFKWACPAYPAFDPYSADLASLQAECSTPSDGVVFDLYQESLAKTESRVTGDGVEPGVAFWDNVAGGVVTVTEHLSVGYGTPVIYCDVYMPSGQDQPDVVLYEVVETAITATLQPGESLMCFWFNVPTDDDGTIEVVKYWCDGYVYDAAHCESYTAGQDFTLFAQAGGDPVNFTTGADGRYVVPAGPTLWTLTEGDGGWCYAASNRTHQPQPLPNPGFDGTSLMVEVVSGETTTIEVFNCDPWTQDDPGDENYGDDWDDATPIGSGDPGPVKALPNTGAGMTVSASGIGAVIAAVQLASLLLVAGIAVRRRRSHR